MKKYTRYQQKILAYARGHDTISVSQIQRHLGCSFLKACEMIQFLRSRKIIGEFQPLTIDKSKLSK